MLRAHSNNDLVEPRNNSHCNTKQKEGLPPVGKRQETTIYEVEIIGSQRERENKKVSNHDFHDYDPESKGRYYDQPSIQARKVTNL